MSNTYIQLEPLEMIQERPFTDPVDSVQDLATLQYMLERLCQILRQPNPVPNWPRPFVLYAQETKGRSHRIAIARLRALLQCDNLTVVGFCGKKRPGADRGPVDTIDEELVAQFPQHPALLSYSTLQFECGNSCNLVLFSNPQGLAHWAMSATHARAVAMAPNYYLHIRLHNAVLPGGLMSNNPLTLVRTKYFDYQDQTMWWAVREL